MEDDDDNMQYNSLFKAQSSKNGSPDDSFSSPIYSPPPQEFGQLDLDTAPVQLQFSFKWDNGPLKGLDEIK
jgi:hypothetical protein